MQTMKTAKNAHRKSEYDVEVVATGDENKPERKIWTKKQTYQPFRLWVKAERKRFQSPKPGTKLALLVAKT